MRQKADKLEKGKWYAEFDIDLHLQSCFLKYLKTDKNIELFDHQIGDMFLVDKNGLIGFIKDMPWFIPTQEDREEFNLVDDE